MGRLKKDHSGWRTHGLWKKYQTPTVIDKPFIIKKKKDTQKWCRGKVGIEHIWHRYQHAHYDWEIDRYRDAWVEIKCQECGKRSYKRMAKTSHMPMHLFVHQENRRTQIQVRVNGKILSFDSPRQDQYWCHYCREFHQIS